MSRRRPASPAHSDRTADVHEEAREVRGLLALIDCRDDISVLDLHNYSPISHHTTQAAMKTPLRRPSPTTEETKWGYAIAGGIALGFAAIIQFAFGDLEGESLANLPAFVRIPYTVAGKLGLTVPLALLGLGLIIRDVLASRRTGAAQVVSLPRGAGLKRGSSCAVPPVPVPAPAATEPADSAADPNAEPIAEELEAGEPLPEEEQTGSGRRKIPALPGRFDGRVSSEEAATGGPAPAASEPSSTKAKSKSKGTVELASAKYLNKNKKGGRNSHQAGT